jgi:hypothetical protein
VVAGVGDFLLIRFRQELDPAALLRQALDVHGAELDVMDRFPQGREVDLIRQNIRS